MPIAIIGSGRSGTSLVSRMLNICGVHLGEHDDIYNADKTNEKGSWEHGRLNEINERVLEYFSRTAMNPPDLATGWENDPGLDPLYEDAQKMVDQVFAGHDIWGWKLPRASLTIPFWRRLNPDLKFIVCVRNPIDFAASINKYYGYSTDFAFDLWQIYNCRILQDTTPEERIITHYESYFPDYRDALKSILDFSGIPMPEEGSPQDIAIREFHEPGLKHHNSTFAEVIGDRRLPYFIAELYLELVSGTDNAADVPLMKNAEAFMPLLLQSADAKFACQLTKGEHNEGGSLAELLVQHSQLERRTHELEAILDSNTHRLATRICDFLIRYPITDFLRHPSRYMKFGYRPQPAAPQPQPTPTVAMDHQLVGR